MRFEPDTLDLSEEDGTLPDIARPQPGLVLVFAASQPAALTLSPGEWPEVGRDSVALAPYADPRMSRRHARFGTAGEKVWVEDLGSHNGTEVDGVRLRPRERRTAHALVRMGDSLFLPVPDVRPFQVLGVKIQDGHVLGPVGQTVHQAVTRSAYLGETLHISGESGVGKEQMAQAFHGCGPRRGGRLVAVNCAAIPKGIAERLLFGARRGAYSGASEDAIGYLQAAHGGTLFLDEVAELDPEVQAKLLRVLETKEIWQLGATRPQTVELSLCSASHKDLRAEAAAGRVRHDLFFRIASPTVVMPPLRSRREEIPWLLAQELGRRAPQLSLHSSIVEACLTRPWPGNVRELLAAVRLALAEVAPDETRLAAQHLSPRTGLSLHPDVAPLAPEPEPDPDPEPRAGRTRARAAGLVPRRAALESALRQHGGNVSQVARALRVHRSQIYRWLERYRISDLASIRLGSGPTVRSRLSAHR